MRSAKVHPSPDPIRTTGKSSWLGGDPILPSPEKVSRKASSLPTLSPTKRSKRADTFWNRRSTVENFRNIQINNIFENTQYGFCSNLVTTTKYTWWNLIPKNLFEQLQRVANVWFLIVSIFQLLPLNLSPTSSWATIVPLSIILCITLVKDTIEDHKRRRSDKQVNERYCEIVEEHVPQTVKMRWKDLMVGSIVRLHNDDLVPADMILLSTSEPDGSCYIETSSLDGETNLKVRQAVDETQLNQNISEVCKLEGSVTCEPPKVSLYNFVGTLRLKGHPRPTSLDARCFLLRGSRVRNVRWVYGLVVYTGRDTKIMMNARQTPFKRSNVERIVNRQLVTVFSVLIVACTVSTIASAVFESEHESLLESLLNFPVNSADTALRWLTFMILYNNLVPISLYVTMDLVRAVQAHLIDTDIAMYHAVTDTPAAARTASLNEDLGQIEYIFSDKTGTLTENAMTFRKCSVNGVMYGDLKAAMAAMSVVAEDEEGELEVESDASTGTTSVSSSSSHLKDKESMDPTTISINVHNGHNVPAEAMSVLRQRHEALSAASANELIPPGRAPARLESAGQMSGPSATFREDPKFAFGDARLLQHLRGNSKHSERLKRFFELLSLCHTVVPDRETDLSSSVSTAHPFHHPLQGHHMSMHAHHRHELTASVDLSKIRYRSNSPDEEALVIAAKCLGYFFYEKKGSLLTVDVFGQPQSFEILGVNEFNSNRKRMSIVVRRIPPPPNEGAILFCKGADNVILERLASDQLGAASTSTLLAHLKQFATEGLRTLVCAMRVLTREEYAQFRQKYHEARTALINRDERLEAVAEEVEKNMELLGATAIEDKIQHGVPECIQTLLTGGLKIWVLTGDKQETAINIGFSCRLLRNSMILIKLNAKSRAHAEILLDQFLDRRRRNSCGTVFSDNGQPLTPGSPSCSKKYALVVDGRTLDFIFASKNLQDKFLDLATACESVMACRVAPLQKAQIVSLVKNNVHPRPMTLAIGDGGNDVSMIQEAHVGVGISGNEGMEAVRASDYSFAQFRFLQRLLLVHGRYNYQRISTVILYSFYKNFCLIMPMFYFTFFNAFSGTTLYDSWILMSYNVAWTAFPILLVGFLDRDVDPEIAEKAPVLYRQGPKRLHFNSLVFSDWLCRGIIHSLIIFLFVVFAFKETSLIGGHTENYDLLGTLAYYCIVITVNVKIAIETKSWTRIFTIMSFCSVILFIPILFFYTMVGFPSHNQQGVAIQLFAEPACWFVLLLAPTICGLLDVMIKFLKRQLHPSPADIVQELSQGYGHGLESSRLLEVPEEHPQPLASGSSRWIEEECDGLNDDNGKERSSYDFSHPSTIEDTEARGNSGVPGNDPKDLSTRTLNHFQESDQRRTIPGTAESGAPDMCLQGVGYDPWTLTFKDLSLETEFKNYFFNKSVPLVRVAVLFIFLLFLGWTIVSNLGTNSTWNLVLSVVVCSVLGVISLFTFTPIFRTYYITFVLAILFVGLGVKVLLEWLQERDGSLSTAIVPTICFVIFRVHFTQALALNVLHLLAYTIRYGVSYHPDNRNAWLNVIDYTPIFIGITVLAGFIGYELEASQRTEFLLERKLGKERQRAVEILHNMLPPFIVDRMQKSDNFIADDQGIVTIVFCDIYDFDSVVASHLPVELVTLLDKIFSMFDKLCEKHGVQKIETVGKTYMACGGVNSNSKSKQISDYLLRCIYLGLDMLDMIQEHTLNDGKRIHLKIGIHTGRVISGVVGSKKPQFALFGDTVNTASRMQSTGEPNHIHMSASSYSYIQDDNRFQFEERQTRVKGKGVMKTYLLTTVDLANGIPYLRRMDTSDQALLLSNGESDMTVTNFDRRKAPSGLSRAGSSMNQFTESRLKAAPIDSFTLKFSDDRDKENLYRSDRRVSAAGSVRSGMWLLLLAYAIVSAEVLLANANESGGSESGLIGLRIGFIAFIFCFQFLIRKTFMMTSLSSICVLLFYLCSTVSTMLQPIVTGRPFTYTTCLEVMLFITVINHTSGLFFMELVIGNLAILILYTVIALTGSATPIPLFLEMFFFLVAFSVINGIAAYVREYFDRRTYILNKIAEEETDHANQLLDQMMPKQVLEELKTGRLGIADEYKEVTLLFADIVGFTDWSSKVSPEAVVRLLKELFSHFDDLTVQLGVYKVHTIGDAYVVIGQGLTDPDRDPAADAEKILQMGMGMLREIRRVRKMINHDLLNMRIGLHTGTIVAGVIGTKTLRYDIWGTDVLAANMMESNGLPGKIIVSSVTKKDLESRNSSRYRFKEHVDVEVRGQAEPITTYIVEDTLCPYLDDSNSNLSSHTAPNTSSLTNNSGVSASTPPPITPMLTKSRTRPLLDFNNQGEDILREFGSSSQEMGFSALDMKQIFEDSPGSTNSRNIHTPTSSKYQRTPDDQYEPTADPYQYEQHAHVQEYRQEDDKLFDEEYERNTTVTELAEGPF